MSHVIKLETFEGPLDALLKIIEEQELDISEVSLAQVTDQYLAYIDAADIDPTEIADFLQVAAKLLLIKSRILLPFADEFEDEDEGDLAEALRQYQQFVKAANQLQNKWHQEVRSYSRVKLSLQKKVGFIPPNVSSSELAEHFTNVVQKIRPKIALPEKTIKRVISLRERIENITKRLQTQAEFYFHDVLQNREDSAEKIVSFLAMLELVKQRKVFVDQQELFTDIIVKRL